MEAATLAAALAASSLVFIDRFNGTSSGLVATDDDDDALGLPINELTSSANGLPLTVWLRALPLLPLLVWLAALVSGRRNTWMEAESLDCFSCIKKPIKSFRLPVKTDGRGAINYRRFPGRFLLLDGDAIGVGRCRC